ncbi:MAG: glycosyltransferase [Metamycoplasmataceae bacterium]
MISLIVPIYSNQIHKHFFNSILEQKSGAFELIILTNNTSNELIDKIQEIEKKSNIKLQAIYSTRKIGFNEAIIEGSKIARGTHGILINACEKLSKNFVNDLSTSVGKNVEADIFEFQPSFKGFENWVPQKRSDLKQNHIFKLKEYPKIIAFTFPFISNKLFKISLANKIGKKTTYIETSSHLSLEFLYLLFLSAESYVYINKPFCNIYIEKYDIPNYLVFYKEWKSIRSIYLLENKFIQEIEYAQIFHNEMIIPILYTHKKLTDILLSSSVQKNLSEKIYEKNKKLRLQEFSSFNYTNKYMLLNLSETEYLNKTHSPKEWSKIIKVLRE